MGSFSKCADSNFKIPDPGDPNQAHFLLAFSIQSQCMRRNDVVFVIYSLFTRTEQQ